jgi:hypothetical protein
MKELLGFILENSRESGALVLETRRRYGRMRAAQKFFSRASELAFSVFPP